VALALGSPVREPCEAGVCALDSEHTPSIALTIENLWETHRGTRVQKADIPPSAQVMSGITRLNRSTSTPSTKR
jgi:hypothetical protein